jgi:hypothetical protein
MILFIDYSFLNARKFGIVFRFLFIHSTTYIYISHQSQLIILLLDFKLTASIGGKSLCQLRRHAVSFSAVSRRRVIEPPRPKFISWIIWPLGVPDNEFDV